MTSARTIAVLLAISTAFSRGEGGEPTRDTLREAERIAMALARGDAGPIEPMLDIPPLQGSVSSGAELLRDVASKLGSIRRVRAAACIANDEATCTISVPMVGEKGTQDLVLVLRGCAFGPRLVSGCRLQPHAPGDGAIYARDGDFVDRPPYVDEASLVRRLFEVDSPAGPLPAILAIPRVASAKARVPAILLLGHAGATDIDASGANCRPLRDIADGLGASGAAVLRVTPRSAVHGDDAYRGEDTFSATDLADARAGLRLLASQPEVDRDAIFVMGLGGGCATAVALATRESIVHGLILFSPPAREGTALDLRRIRVAIAAGDLPESEEQRMREAAAAVADRHALETRRYQHRPAPWWREVESMDLPEMTKSFAGHVFIAIAGRDLTVEQGDLEAWRSVASGRERVVGRQYPHLDSNFARRLAEVPEGARPAVFVAPEVLRDVLSFLNSTTKPSRAGTSERAPRRTGK